MFLLSMSITPNVIRVLSFYVHFPRGPRRRLRHGVLDECYSGIPRTPAGSLVLGDGSPSIPTFTPYTLRSTPLTGIPTCCLAFEIPISKMLSLPFIL